MDKAVLFDELIGYMRGRNRDISKVERAFAFADEKHKGQYRKGGDEYIVHPLDVALILAKLDLEPDVVCGAILHDTMEDCGVSKAEIAEKFGANVADIVDSVSEISKSKFVVDNDNLFEDNRFAKFSRDEQTFKKLVGLGKKNIFGFYIKLADRLNNLRTIGPFEEYKKKEKVAETERWLMPIAKVLGANYFYRAIENECFKIIYEKEIHFFDTIQYYRGLIRPYIVNNVNIINNLFLSHKLNSMVEWHYEYSCNLWKDLQNVVGIRQMNVLSQGKLNKIAMFEIKYLFKSEKDKFDAIKVFLDNMTMGVNKELSLISAEIDDLTQMPHYVIRDSHSNIFNVYLLTEREYYTDRLGTLEGTNIDYIDDDNTHEIDTNFMRVYTRSQEAIFVPDDCTALDFAFKIHNDLGFAFKYAIINNSPTKYPPYTKLNPDDKVEIVTAKDGAGNLQNVAEMKWLAYVQTASAKKALIKHFERCLNREEK